ncbi:MAG: hypothetical protein J6K61_06785 [Clostridia bacterium]|nr:hypothetical protein [Clostridia bacterium]
MAHKQEAQFFAKDKEIFMQLADKEKATQKPLLLSPFLSAFRAYLLDYVDSEVAADISLDFCAFADEERLVTVLTLLYTELKAAFADLTLSAYAEDDTAYIVFAGTAGEKGDDSSLLGVARAARCDTLSLLWAERISRAAGAALSFSWKKEQVRVSLSLSAFPVLAAVLETHKTDFTVESAARFACHMLGALPDIEGL